MQQNWKPLGQLVKAPLDLPWAKTHAAYPTDLERAGQRGTIFFSPRDEFGRSHVAAIDVEIQGDNVRLTSEVQGPFISPGARGEFDADGASISCIIREGGDLFAYYLGWTKGDSVPFANFIGLAIAKGDSGKFEKLSNVPIVGRTIENPICVGYPWVYRVGDAWQMWFGSHLLWGERRLEMEHVLKRAASNDGIHWTPEKAIVVGLDRATSPEEYAISRPTVLSHNGRLLMWYARRSPNYSLGFAWQHNDGSWRRADSALQFGQSDAWTEGTRTYPCVFKQGGEFYMLYNGSGYGLTGFGIARLTNPDSLNLG